jgi:cell division protein FtsL|tara:strand:- start:992 stop:1249 length:258 start_codon:yes stop_codon:yes gene_type:complete
MKLDAWKIFTTALAVVVTPLAGWVWTMNVEVAQLRNDLGDLEEQVEQLEAEVDKAEEASRTLIKVESDLGHLREILSRIEDLVTK